VSGSRRALAITAASLCAVLAGSGPAWAGNGNGHGNGHGPTNGQGSKKHPGPAAGSEVTVTQVASGLDNPRDLAFGPAGRLYLAEAGHGGSECIPGGPGGEEQCIGFTSGISRIDLSSGAHHRVVDGLVSAAGPDGSFATGIDGVSLLGNGELFGIENESSDVIPPQASELLSAETIEKAKAQLGRLIKANPSGNWRPVVDVGGFDFQWSLEHKELVPEQFPDANPYAVLTEGGRNWVVDAASNTVDEVRANGSISVVAFIPNPPISSDAVPTCIDRGPDGALYVGELTGGGNPPGSSVVWRLVPGQAPTEWASGLTAVTGCGFGSDSQFYAVEFSTKGLDAAEAGTGAVVRVPAHSTSPTTVVDELSFPGGFASANGALYISNWSIAQAVDPGGPTGEVLKIVP